MNAECKAVFLKMLLHPAPIGEGLNRKQKHWKGFEWILKDSFTEAVETFVQNADWLTEEDEPMVTGLMICARNLDKRFSAATYAQFGLTFRFLAKKAPNGEGVRDPLEALLNE